MFITEGQIVHYKSPYERGELIVLPDAPGDTLEVINVGDGPDITLRGTAHEGSTITIPVGSQLRKAKTSMDKEHAHLRAYLYTVMTSGDKQYLWMPERDWHDPRFS